LLSAGRGACGLGQPIRFSPRRMTAVKTAKKRIDLFISYFLCDFLFSKGNSMQTRSY
jgi:hypothetical protein